MTYAAAEKLVERVGVAINATPVVFAEYDNLELVMLFWKKIKLKLSVVY